VRFNQDPEKDQKLEALKNTSSWQRKEHRMATTAMGPITIVYRGETQQFKTVSIAAHFLRNPQIKVGWFHTVKAAVDLMSNGKVSQTRHLKGDKYLIIKELEQLESALKLSPA
jgi:hypothetical protein